MIKKVVIDLLKKPCLSDPRKTIGNAFVDGTISVEDLQYLNHTPRSFPANGINQLKLVEGRYSSEDAINDFINILEPFLSDQVIFKITDMLAHIESYKNTEMYRNSCLAKAFLKLENKRQCEKSEHKRKPPATFLAHFKVWISPSISLNWKGTERQSGDLAFINFISFNLQPPFDLEDISLIKDFPLDAFSIEKLSSVSERPAHEFNMSLTDLQNEYDKLSEKPSSLIPTHLPSVPDKPGKKSSFFSSLFGSKPQVPTTISKPQNYRKSMSVLLSENKEEMEQLIKQLTKIDQSKGREYIKVESAISTIEFTIAKKRDIFKDDAVFNEETVTDKDNLNSLTKELKLLKMEIDKNTLNIELLKNKLAENMSQEEESTAIALG